MEEIINSLCIDDNQKFNYEAVKKARENKGEINKYLLEEIKKMLKDFEEKGEEYLPIFFDYSVFLLAEFKDKNLFPLLIQLLDRPNIDTFEVIGGGIMDKLPSIIASVFNNDFDSLNKIIENKEIDGYCRGRTLFTYKYFYENNLISKDNLIKYLRKLIKLYNYDDTWMYQEILSIVAECHLFEMMKDVQIMFQKGAIDLQFRGDYDSFIDDIFDHDDKYSEKVQPIEDIEKEMAWWAYFKNDETKKNSEEISNKITDLFQNELEKNYVSYNKVGRNDPCPCGSGKKYKKCCLEKEETILPYQGYITKSLSHYPQKNNHKNQVDFYSYYKEEYIKIDELLYKALRRKEIPIFIGRDKQKEQNIDFEYLTQAYELIKIVLEKNNFKTINEYDEEVSIHYSLYRFFEKYSSIIIDKITSPKSEYITKLKNLLDLFYNHFDLENDPSTLFLDRKNAYYILSENFEEGIKFFQDKLSDNKWDKYNIYGFLFDEYRGCYSYEQAMKKIDETINQEKDKSLQTELQQLKLEFMY